MSRATVYNTLDALCKAGLVRQVATSGHGPARYDADLSDHVHFRSCDSSVLRDVPEHLSRQLLEHLPPAVIADIEAALGVRIDGISVHLLGQVRAASTT